MTTQLLGWVVAAVCTIVAAAVFVWQRRRIRTLTADVENADRRLALLDQLAPPLTEAVLDSTAQTCERIVERLGSFIGAQTILCFVATDGRLVLGAKSDSGYAEFLRVGNAYEGDNILDWAQRNHCPAVVGPTYADLPPDAPLVDMSTQPDGKRSGGPLVGGRDRVWALCIPMMGHRGYGLRPAVIGALYIERPHDAPLMHDQIRSALMVARLAGDSLQRARFADEVKRAAELDQLTQLLTAVTFRKRLREEIDMRRRGLQYRDVSLFFIDTDRFKLWNDTFGHAVGDMLLTKLADIFREVGASGGFAGRNGGDEFCIALLDRTKDDAIAVAENLRERIENTDFMAGPEDVPQPRIPITVSIGVAHFPVDVPATASAPSDRLLEIADARMYDAKRDGRNRVAYSRARQLQTRL